MKLFNDPSTSATSSECGKYRYTLSRIWDETKPPVVWIMLNPSTADATVNDPTIRKCITFAHAWNAGGIWVGNLFAWRATDPKVLKTLVDPVGPDNNYHIRGLMEIARCGGGRIVCAWGKDGRLRGRDAQVLSILSVANNVFAMHINGDGTPKHPLYLRGDLMPIPFGKETP